MRLTIRVLFLVVRVSGLWAHKEYKGGSPGHPGPLIGTLLHTWCVHNTSIQHSSTLLAFNTCRFRRGCCAELCEGLSWPQGLSGEWRKQRGPNGTSWHQQRGRRSARCGKLYCSSSSIGAARCSFVRALCVPAQPGPPAEVADTVSVCHTQVIEAGSRAPGRPVAPGPEAAAADGDCSR